MGRPDTSPFVVILLWASGLCVAAQFAKIAAVLPELEALYPNAGASLGLLVSAISIVGIVFGLIGGLLAVRFGPRRLLLASLVLGTATSAAQALLPPLPLMLGSRVLEGVSHLGIVVAAPTLIAAASAARWRAVAMTLWGTFFGVSFALTAWLGLPLVEEHGVGALFLAHALCTAAVAALVGITLGADSGHGAGNDTGSAPDAEPFVPGRLLQRHVRAWTSPFVAAPAAGWVAYTVTFVSLLAVLPGLMPPDERAFAAMMMPLASIAASMTIGVVLLLRLSAVLTIGIGFAGASLVAATLAFVPVGPILGIALFAALGLVQGASFAAVPELNGDAASQALANGAIAQAGNFGNACGTPLLLSLLALAGLEAMVAAVVLCYVVGIAIHVVMARRRARAVRVERASGSLT